MPFESTPLAAVAFGSPPRAADCLCFVAPSSRYHLGPYSSHLPGAELGPKDHSTLPGVELGLEDNLPPAWCKTGPQGPPPRLKDHCPVLLGIFLVCRRHPRVFNDALDFFIVPSCTSYYCTNRYQECV